MKPVVCMITDRMRLSRADEEGVADAVAAAIASGVDLIQIRERDLDGGPLLRLVRRCVAAAAGTRTRILVNDRLDVALAAGAHGVHLRADSVPARRVRAMAPRGFLIGRSVHHPDEATAADAEGAADFLLFGNVYETASKPGIRAAGLEALRRVVDATTLPVLAVGGVTGERIPEIIRAGAAGYAAIGLFLR